jgi:hypothetical protein
MCCYLAIAGVLLEYASKPLPVYAITPHNQVPPVYKYVRAHPEKGAAVVLPNSWAHPNDVRCMYYLIPGYTELTNGYSGYAPFLYQALLRELYSYPSAQSVDTLRKLGASYVVVDREHFKLTHPRRARDLFLSGDADNDLYLVERVTKSEAFLVGPEEAEPNQALEYALVLPDASVCADISAVEFSARAKGGTKSLDTTPLTGCLPAKENRATYSFRVRLPAEESDVRLRATVTRRSENEPIVLEKTVQLKKGFYDTRDPDTVMARLEAIDCPPTVKANEEFQIRLRATNVGNTIWVGDEEDDEMRAVRFRGEEARGVGWNPFGPQERFSAKHFGAVHLTVAHWRRKGTPLLVRAEGYELLTARGYLGRDIRPGQAGEFVMRVKAPPGAGVYNLKLGMRGEYSRHLGFNVQLESASASPYRIIRVE